ncbi:hypothetical protein CBR_g55227 [Chara braunii]|uniref:HAT C-terminal dimerisation domain-containing protein n=1 Tax=Chara braunii TaxID=69332 RepID=A0A388MCQ3_CHABU|nr:hypothetical protein CBR_g55227 [Chara braunii]|eukprot:GBG92346.1 hypothetical protein CBR_g55227 [Chara braunii]
MGRAQRREHEPASQDVQDTFRVRSPVYRYLVVGQKVDNNGVMMLHCTFCNKVFQGALFQATRHFMQTNYCKAVTDEALYEIEKWTQLKSEADQMERISRFAVERGLDVPLAGAATGGEAAQRPREVGGGGETGHGEPNQPLGGRGGGIEGDVITDDREARGTTREGFLGHEDQPEFDPLTGERIVDWQQRGGKGQQPPVKEPTWDPWWQRVATIVHIMELLRRMDRGGQFMSLVLEWAQDLVQRVKKACAPLGSLIADRITRRVQARSRHMLEPAHCAGFLLNPRRRHVRYFSGEVQEYHAWLVRQAKRYILTQTGFDLEGAEYLRACLQFEDFHMQQGRFGDWGGAEGRACGRPCSGDTETIECASWWSQYGALALELQRCALRVMHMWSCASRGERNWAVHEGIHTKKRNRLARDAVRDVTLLHRRIFDRRLEHPAWQAIPSVPWGPASPVWSGSTSTGGRTARDVPGVSGSVQETTPHERNMPPPPPRPPVGDPSSSPTGRGSRSPQTPGRSRIRDTTAALRDVCDTSIFGSTDIDLDSTRRVTEHTSRLQSGLGGVGARTTAARGVPASSCEPQRGRG